MPDNDYRPDEESDELARKLALNTVKDFRDRQESSSEREASRITLAMHARELGVDAPMRDVTFVLQEFAWQWELARDFGGQMPCVKIGDDKQWETVPLSLPFNWGLLGPFRSRISLRRFVPFFYEEYQEFLRSRGKSEGYSMEPADNALEHLQKGFTSIP